MSPVEIGLLIVVLLLVVAIVYLLSHLPQVQAGLTRVETGAKAEAARVEAAARQDWETLKTDSENDLQRLERALGFVRVVPPQIAAIAAPAVAPAVPAVAKAPVAAAAPAAP